MNRARIDALFARALDVSDDERAEWLARECADEAERADVERLLRADARASDFLERPPALVAAAVNGVVNERAGPTVFGAYRVVRSIGVGGMGEVWLAERDDGEFQQRVAIKRLAYPTPGLLHRFRQERQILARLEHAHIARLIDGGLDAGGMPYLAMEYVEGVSITRYVGDTMPDLRALLELFLRVCDAVQYAHQNLVVHRDLKPSNIFVTADGTPKLLDFGIAKVLSADTTDAPTQTVARLLTPDYAAPEQFDGGAITTATDVYALGVVLYELLTGVHPHRHARGGANAGGAVDPPPPSAVRRDRRGSRTGGRVPRGDLDRIVLVAIAHEAPRRYASAAAFAADIRRYLDGRPVSANPGSIGYRLRKFAARNRYPLGAALVVVAACVAATAVGWRQMQRANEQAARAQAARQFLAGVFEQAGPDGNKGRAMTAHELLEKGERQLTQGFDGDPAIRADLTGLISGLYWDIGDHERGLALLTTVEPLNRDPRVPDEIKARNLALQASIETGNQAGEQALAHARLALEHAERAGSVAARERSDARRLVARGLLTSGGADRADIVRQLQDLVTDDRARFGEGSDAVAKDLTELGIALWNADRSDEAIAACEQALAINRTLHGERSIAASEDLFYIGMSLRKEQAYARAEAVLAEVVSIRSDVYGVAHPETIDARMYLLLMKEEQGRHAEALPERLSLLEEQRRFRDTDPNMLANAYTQLGYSYNVLGMPVDAERVLRESLAIWTRKEGNGGGIAGIYPLSALAGALQMQGRYTEAETTEREAIETAQAMAPSKREFLATERASLGNLLRLQHRDEEALALLRATADAAERDAINRAAAMRVYALLAEAELDGGDPGRARVAATRALELGRAALPPAHFRLGYPLYAMARVELAQERAADAEPLLREALAVRAPLHRPEDLRILEIETALVDALTALGRTDEAHALRGRIEPLLQASPSPYANDLLARLPSHDGTRGAASGPGR